jgi:uncharacterized membrane protein YhaH (DUF805 family)
MLGTVFSLQGKIGRVPYWGLIGLSLVMVFIAAAIGSLTRDNQPMQWFCYAVLLSSSLPILSATVRRMHDIGLDTRSILLFMAITGAVQVIGVLTSTAYPVVGTLATALSGMALVGLGLMPGIPDALGD